MLGFSIGVLGALALGAAQDTSREVVTPAALKAVVKDYRKAQQAEFAKLPDLAKLEGARFKLTIPFGKYARNARYEYDK